MTLVYGTVCDGISAVSTAWAPLGMRCAWRSEIADFPARVAAERHPGAPNLGDFTRIGLDAPPPEPAIDVLVGGTPCQSFSVAGGRAGLDDPRGHLAVEFLLLARRLGARWVVWENVPGVFSADGGDAFATFLGLMVECGYGLCWRVLDAQGFGVPQRRNRVFVVGYLGDWRPPVAVLLERPSLHRDPRARSPKGTSLAVPAGVGADRGVAHTITAHHGRNSSEDIYAVANTIRTATRSAQVEDTLAVARTIIGIGRDGDPMYTITTRGDHAVFAFDQAQITSKENRATVSPAAPVPTISRDSRTTVAGSLWPRRLTPREVERCFGFPDDYTAIEGASDSARYEALGNSMAVPVMAWIGRRLLVVDGLTRRAT